MKNGESFPLRKYYAPTVYHDGNSPVWETNDCVVRAISIAAKLSYEDAHAICKSHGRKDREGIYWTPLLLKTWFGEVIHYSNPYDRQFPKTSLGKWIKQNPFGRWIIATDGHAMAVIDGIVYDHSLWGLRTRVTFACRVD